MSVYFNNNESLNVYWRKSLTDSYKSMNYAYFNNTRIFPSINYFYFVKSNYLQVSAKTSSLVLTQYSSGYRVQAPEATWGFRNCLIFETNLSSYIGKGYYLRLNASQALRMFGNPVYGDPHSSLPTGTAVNVNTDYSLDSIVSTSSPYLVIFFSDYSDVWIYDLYIHT